MTEQELINKIFEKCNSLAMITGLHVGNVAYVSDKHKHLCLSKAWEIGDRNKLMLMNNITVFFKPFEHDNIFVNYMKDPSDEMVYIPQPSSATKQRSFLKIGNTRIDVNDITHYNRQRQDQLYIHLRYNKNSICLTESPLNIKNAIQMLDAYFNIQTII